jgi:hypothetical protein
MQIGINKPVILNDDAQRAKPKQDRSLGLDARACFARGSGDAADVVPPVARHDARRDCL